MSLNPGGTEKLVLDLAKRLHADIPMAVCCLDQKGAWAQELEAASISVSELRRPQGFTPSLGRTIAHLARATGARVLHCHHYSPFVYGCVARVWSPRTRLVFTEHGRLSDAPPSAKRRAANLLLSRVPSRVFAVSAELRQHIVAEGFPERRVDVIYNGIDPGVLPTLACRQAIRDRLNVAATELVVGSVARLSPVKDLGVLIRSIALLNERRSATLVLIGDGEERDALTAIARDTGMSERVRFLGHRDDARTWLSGFDVYVNSSISEGISLTILEAMAAGLPVVATRVGGTPEIVNETCGTLVPPREPAAIADALLQLADRPDRRSDLGSAARHRVEDVFALDRMVADYRDVYRQLL